MFDYSGIDTAAAGFVMSIEQLDTADTGVVMSIEQLNPHATAYKQKLRSDPEPKRMHAVDQEAIVAVLHGLSDGEISSDDQSEGSHSVTATDTEDCLSSDAAEFEAMAVEKGSGTDTWVDDDTSFDHSTAEESEEIQSSDEDGGFDYTQSDISSMMDQLRSQGWSETAIEAWAKKDQDMARALLRYVTASGSVSGHLPQANTLKTGLRILFETQ